jgi:lipid II:glycine glycyltransferase (peptidoglycan interpeptide bridge formation enzyme)
LNVLIIDPITDKRWDEFVIQHPEGTIFHHSSWARVLIDRYNAEPSYYAVENNQGKFTAIAPFFRVPSPLGGERLVCLPCSEYCFPLGYDSSDVESLIIRAKEEVNSKHISYLEIRGLKGNIKTDSLSLKERPYYLNHSTILNGTPQDLRAGFSRDTRYHLNRGEKSGIMIRLAQTENDLKKYHHLVNTARRRINSLPFPYRFFQSIYRHIILPGYGFLLLAEADQRLVSGGVFFCLNNKVLNKFNASDPEYIQLRSNYLLMWRAIEYAYEKSYRYFDFGVTNPENTGLVNFKRHWGSIETTLSYYYYPDIHVHSVNSVSRANLIYRTYTGINKILPDFALKLASEILYRRLG